jgi:hypothetical protein
MSFQENAPKKYKTIKAHLDTYLSRCFSGTFFFVSSSRVVHGASLEMRLPCISWAEYKLLDRVLTSMRSIQGNTCLQLSRFPRGVTCEMLVHPVATCQDSLMAWTYDDRSVRQYSLYRDNILLLRTVFVPFEQCRWQFCRELNKLESINPLLLLREPTLVRHWPQVALAPCTCFDCLILDETPVRLFEEHSELLVGYPTMFKWMKNCKAVCKHLTAPLFEAPMTLQFKFQHIIDAHCQSQGKAYEEATERRWYSQS